MQSTSVRIDRKTHQELTRIAAQRDATIGETIALMVRRFRQDLIADELATPLRSEDVEWLSADGG